MNNKNVFVILAGLVILNLIVFFLVNYLLFVPAWLNLAMAGVEMFCLLLTLYGRIKNFKNIDASIGIILNIFLLLLLTASVILYKSR